jgi:hypothetical protein
LFVKELRSPALPFSVAALSAAEKRDFKEIFSINQLISKNSLLPPTPSFELILPAFGRPRCALPCERGANINASLPAWQAFSKR